MERNNCERLGEVRIMKLTRSQLRKIILKEFMTIMNESIDVRGVRVNWNKRVDGDPAVSFDGNLYTLTGPGGIPIEIEDMEYFEKPERVEVVATADLPGPINKRVKDETDPSGIDTIVKGVKSGGDFKVKGKFGTIKYEKA